MWTEFRWWLWKLWLIAWYRPILVCPFCKGTGGEMGYSDCGDEWNECRECYEDWSELTNWDMRWFSGRVPVWRWVQGKASMACGLWYTVTLRGLIACKLLGWHRWIDEDLEPGLRICPRCWAHGHVRDGHFSIDRDRY